MNVQALYDYAKQHNIEVLPFPMIENGSMSIMTDNGSCYIGMDSSVKDNGILELTHLGHEIGHCETGSFYSIHTAVDSRQRHENRADKWAIKKLIPIDDLDSAIGNGYTELWELAEHFGVTEQFMQKAVCYYVHGNLASEMYF